MRTSDPAVRRRGQVIESAFDLCYYLSVGSSAGNRDRTCMLQLPFHRFRGPRGYTGVCQNCGAVTSNPKFCTKSCAALFNNRRTDIRRRQPEGSCRDCGATIKTSRVYCLDCRVRRRDSLVIEASNSNAGKNPYTRAQARRLYILAGRPLSCVICRYSSHVDICHVKDVRTYPVGTPYTIVNDQANLIALCKNHHWEFDNGLL